MTGFEGDQTGDDSDPSPWAADTIPPATGPVVWDSPSDDGEEVVESIGDVAQADAPDETESRRWKWPAAAVGAALIAVIAVGALTRDVAIDGSTTDESTADVGVAVPEPEALPTLDDASDEDDSDEPRSEISYADDRVAVEPGAGDDSPSTTIEVPDAVAAIEEPTEVVAIASSGELHTLSLPSRTVRTTELGSVSGGASLSVSPDATLVTSYNQTAILVPRSGPPVVIDRDDLTLDDGTTVANIEGYGWLPNEDGSSSILAIGYADNSNANNLYLVEADGTVVEDDAEFAASNFSFFTYSPGARFVNDAGGVYRIATDGSSTRVSDGAAIAASADRLVVRECDAERRCTYVSRSLDGGDAVPLPDASATAVSEVQFGATLSPDGSALTYPVFGQTQQQVVLDLTTGETTTADAEQNGFGFGFSAAWAPDSSGLFLSGGPDGGLAFLDRATGEVLPFAEELGEITSIDIRYPDAELLESVADADSISLSADPVADIGIDVVAVGRLGVMTYLDLDGATATRWETPSLPVGQTPRLFSDSSSVLVLSESGSRGFVSQFGRATALDGDALPSPPFLPGPTDGDVWARSETATLDVDSMLVGLDGSPVDDGITIAVGDATLLGGDSSGGLLLETGGDVYVSSGGDAAGFTTGLNRLTTGEVLAVGTNHAIVRECDAVRECTTSKLDRSTGELTTITGSAILGSDPVGDERDVSLIGSMSPDGEVVLARLDSEVSDDEGSEEMWALFDLEAGTTTMVGVPSEGQPLIWNDDSSYAVLASFDAVMIYERSTASVIAVDGAIEARGLAEVDESFAGGSADSDQG